VIGILLYAPPRLTGWPGFAVVWGLTTGMLLSLPAWLDDRLMRLGLFFLKVGAPLFGSGMVLFAFIQRDVVGRYGWLTQESGYLGAG